MDSEALVVYAKLVWQLHHDHDKASSYYERAIQATPTDSHILAAYASFLWETENDDENGSDSVLPNTVSLQEAISSSSAQLATYPVNIDLRKPTISGEASGSAHNFSRETQGDRLLRGHDEGGAT